MGLTTNERLTLAILGGLAIAGLGLRLWQQRHAPIAVAAGTPPQYAHWEALVGTVRVVDLNTATASELERLPEIGPTTATRIVAYRAMHGAFRRPEALLDVPGIGPRTYEAVKDYVTVRE